jgi:hypothetical protein
MAHRDQARPPAMVAKNVTYQTSSWTRMNVAYQKFKTYFAGCDVHEKIHWGEITRERETILNELKDGEPRRPYVCADSVLPPCDAFGLE